MTYDVAIAGGGPAGAWAARTLARHGAHVAIVDGSHPREKPCGGGVTGRALALVGDALDGAALPRRRIRCARFVDHARSRSTVVPLGECDLEVCGRADFDGALLSAAEAAGACLVRARATDISRDRDGFTVATRTGPIRARLLIGADGANSLVRRRLARAFDRADLSTAAGYFVRGASSDEIVLELLADPPGYIWSFPRPGHLAVGICTQADAGVPVGALRATALEWIRRNGLDSGSLVPYSWPIPSLRAERLASLTTSGPGWCLAGDAAGLVDPITREGIYFALLSGDWAARALASAEAEPERRYQERVQDEIGAELVRAARYKAAFFQPGFIDLLGEALAESLGVREVMARLVAGTQPYATLKWSLAKTVEVGLAWRLVRAKWYNRRSTFKEY